MSADREKLIGSCVLVGGFLAVIAVTLVFVGIWADWRWAISAVLPGAGAFGLLKFAWHIS